MKARALGFVKQAGRYQGDLHEIALYPYNNIPTPQRVSMLDDHYRRLAYRDQPSAVGSILRSAGKGALIAGAAVFMRQTSMDRHAGSSLKKSMAAGWHAAKWPAPLVGAMVAAPFGLFPVFKAQAESFRARKIVEMPEAKREELLRGEVARALR